MAEQIANRTPRDLESREKKARAVYVPPSTLPEPIPAPGYVYRWIATSIMGQADPSNVSKRLRDGWEPVAAKDHPELQMYAHNERDGNGSVEMGGLMLCRKTTEMADARNEYFARKALSQMESVDSSFMRENDPRMPLFNERKTQVSRSGFGKGIK
jgi:hypothetical protein